MITSKKPVTASSSSFHRIAAATGTDGNAVSESVRDSVEGIMVVISDGNF